jgi:predicted 2-oxoglutarate/Fe(II)-dependent dioxygenase YbiX
MEDTWIAPYSIKVMNNFLEKGDFLPFISFKTINDTIIYIHSFCDSKPFILITVSHIDKVKNIHDTLVNLIEDFHIIIITDEKSEFIREKGIIYTCDEIFKKMFQITENLLFYIISPNRRIKYIFNSIENILKVDNFYSNTHVPYLLIEDVLNDTLMEELINYFEYSKYQEKIQSHSTSTKERQHVHPSYELEKKLDNKLSRSLFPELKKVFYHNVTHRENYKICCYDSKTSGRFHAHRDTPKPYQHRKYAMSLLLNDDYEGGEFYLPEYNIKIKPKKNSAIIFPGINSHQVLEVKKGARMAIISFFVNGDLRPQYKLKSHFYKDNDIQESDVYPQ